MSAVGTGARYDPHYPCDGCGGADATEALWMEPPLGLCCVHVHRDRACAEAARMRRGGGRFVPEPRSAAERAGVDARPQPTPRGPVLPGPLLPERLQALDEALRSTKRRQIA